MDQVYLGLGSNLGQRRLNLEQALLGLGSAMKLMAVSPLYETDPWGLVEQPKFLNLCVSGTTSLSPLQLLSFIKNLEVELGRQQSVQWGPRTIDIDILLFSDIILVTDNLKIPHPYLTKRAFALIPLADIGADALYPPTGQTIAELAAAVDRKGLRRVAGPPDIPTNNRN